MNGAVVSMEPEELELSSFDQRGGLGEPAQPS